MKNSSIPYDSVYDSNNLILINIKCCDVSCPIALWLRFENGLAGSILAFRCVLSDIDIVATITGCLTE